VLFEWIVTKLSLKFDSKQKSGSAVPPHVKYAFHTTSKLKLKKKRKIITFLSFLTYLFTVYGLLVC